MKRYKVCVYAICKDEENFVDRWMDAVEEADLVVVTDTGSSDATVEKLRERGAVVYTDIISPWRFDVARNIAMDHVPDDADICVSVDLDEVFDRDWRRKLEDAWQSCHTRARYLFTWSYNNDGSPNKQFAMEKIHRRHGFRWVHPVHEVLEYSGADKDMPIWVDGIVLNHHPDLSKPRTQYLPLLELSAQENPSDDRTAFWLGREYMYHGMHDKCIETLMRHIDLPSATWDEERCASMRFIAKSFLAKGENKQARKWLFKAIAECPRVREPYLQMARLGYLEGDWPLVYLMTQRALLVTQKSGSYLVEPDSWNYSLYDLGAICTYRLGLYEKSYEYAKIACQMEPDNERLKNNLELIKLKVRAGESSE